MPQIRRNIMASDIKLDNNNVILEGNVGIGTNNPIRPLHVEGMEIHSGGASSGFSFDDRKKGNGERWVWYAENGEAHLFSQKTGQKALSVLSKDSNGWPRMSVLTLNSLQVTTEGIQGVPPLTGGVPTVRISGNVHIPDNVGIGTNSPIRKLHVEGSEIHTGGAGSGFSFDDRKKGNSERWVWYADDGMAHLFSQKTGQNALSIQPGGNVGIGTNSPTNKLHIVGDGSVTIENPNGEADILFKSGNNQTWQVGTNSFGWYVWDDSYRLVVKPGGNVGIGTNNPASKLHVEGGEIYSSGSQAGFAFSDQFDTSAAWRWYAAGSAIRLGPKGLGADALTIGSYSPNKTTYFVEVNGSLVTAVSELRGVIPDTEPKLSTIRCRAAAFTLEDPSAPLSTPGTKTELTRENGSVSAPPPPPPTIPVPPRIALLHAFVENQKDCLVINYQGRYKDGVKLEGNVQTTGALTQASSIALKENIAELSGQEAMATLQGLNAVKYNYKADEQKEQRIGFIAEEVPDLVANSERDRLSPMDLIAILTKALQELAAEVNSLKQQNRGM
jgi:hypothetical protein